MSKNSTWESTVKPVVVLSVIALIVSLLLALVNSFTAPIIEEHLKAATLAAYVDVMPTVSSASDLDEVTDWVSNGTFLPDNASLNSFLSPIYLLHLMFYSFV